MTDPTDDRVRLNEWLKLLGGPGYKGREAWDRAVAEMRIAGADRLFALLIPMLASADPEDRCAACEALALVDPHRASELIIQTLNDVDPVVRMVACGCLHDFGNDGAIAALEQILRRESDAQVRTSAGRALGGIGSPKAIPTLLTAMENDHEMDMHGHSTASVAATALDDILGTNEARFKLPGGLRTMTSRPPNLERLRQLARIAYEQWSDSQLT